MSSGDRKDGPAARTSQPSGPGSGEELLTSEDLFGDMLDKAAPEAAPAASASPAAAPPAPRVMAAKPTPSPLSRRSPIKVQVSEPGAIQKPTGDGDGSGEPLPDDIAALLDAFSEPGEAATRSEVQGRPEAPPPPAPASAPVVADLAPEPEPDVLMSDLAPEPAVLAPRTDVRVSALAPEPRAADPEGLVPDLAPEPELLDLPPPAAAPPAEARPRTPQTDFGGVDVLFEALIHDDPPAPASAEPARPAVVPPASAEPARPAASPPASAQPARPAASPAPRASAARLDRTDTGDLDLEDELAPPPWVERPPLEAEGDDEPDALSELSLEAHERPRSAAAGAGSGMEDLLDGPLPPAEARAPDASPREAAAAPPRSRKPAKSAGDPLADFMKTLPRGHREAQRADPAAEPRPTSRTGTKFGIADPGPAAPESGGLDLAALADDALSAATPPSGVFAATGQAVPPPPAPEAPAPPPVVAAAAPKRRGGEIVYGPYRLLEKVAVGGMAEVFRAKRSGVEGFEKVVAVKRILPHLSDNKEFLDMFVDEAKMVAGLTHPNIVQIFDLGKIEKSYYIAMEYVQGRDLRSILRRCKERGMRVPLDLVVLIVSRMSAALEYAHRARDEAGRPMRIVHRDVSPQNILISFEGDVKLTDFGIAKAATKASTTDRGALRGKLLYMSPEQAWGKSMDRRSDIYSLGIVFYEMLTDQKPFLGGSEMSVLEMVREGKVAPPSTLRAEVPERLERVVMKVLEKDPEQRYQDAADLGRDLERVLHERQPPTSAALARFLEILFDSEERGDSASLAHDSHDSGPHGSGSGVLEIDFDTTMPGTRSRSDVSPAPEGPRDPKDKDTKSIQGLLKRFGIK